MGQTQIMHMASRNPDAGKSWPVQQVSRSSVRLKTVMYMLDAINTHSSKMLNTLACIHGRHADMLLSVFSAVLVLRHCIKLIALLHTAHTPCLQAQRIASALIPRAGLVRTGWMPVEPTSGGNTVSVQPPLQATFAL